jgi:hypothetical protein
VGTVSGLREQLPKEGQTFFMFNNDVTADAGEFDCSPTKMTFRIRLAKGTKDGGIEFRQESNPFGGWVLNVCDAA